MSIYLTVFVTLNVVFILTPRVAAKSTIIASTNRSVPNDLLWGVVFVTLSPKLTYIGQVTQYVTPTQPPCYKL